VRLPIPPPRRGDTRVLGIRVHRVTRALACDRSVRTRHMVRTYRTRSNNCGGSSSHERPDGIRPGVEKLSDSFLIFHFPVGMRSQYPTRPEITMGIAEAPDGFEPPNKGFADLSLTTWVRRHRVPGPPGNLSCRCGQGDYSCPERNKTPPPGGIGGGGATLKRKCIERNMRCDYRMFHCLDCSRQSGKRDSNPRHQPWQGCALPTELFPHR
jgi:hypothetical protein